MTAQNPATPSFIFRGHAAAIHALHFFSQNKYLASGDSDGYIVIWSVAYKRPVAVWRGHAGGIMAIRHWGSDRLLSHGRDHFLRVWQLRSQDYENLSIELPVDGGGADKNKQPWLLHSMAANALNYCAFSMCVDTSVGNEPTTGEDHKPLLIATPNGLDAGGVDIFQLPSQHRLNKIPSDTNMQSGMVMALSLFQHPRRQQLALIAGFESGHILVSVRTRVDANGWKWDKLLVCQPHSQPVLSIDTTTNFEYFFTSSADALITKYAIPPGTVAQPVAEKVVNTKHAGQQDLAIRDDGKVLATAGWDKRVRVYSVKTLKELAVLKWHQEGCYAVAFAETIIQSFNVDDESNVNASLVKSTVELLKDERSRKAQNTHWLAAGGKDGKISLWDIY